MIRVLFVCLGNICRSPLAHGVLRDRIRERDLEGVLGVDGCGTSSYHNGEPPDSNMIAVAARHGVRIGDLVSRQLVRSDFVDFQLIVPMDGSNERDVRRMAGGSDAEITRFTDFVPDDVFSGDGVPDPYYGGMEGFEQVFSIVDAGCDAVLERALELAEG